MTTMGRSGQNPPISMVDDARVSLGDILAMALLDVHRKATNRRIEADHNCAIGAIRFNSSDDLHVTLKGYRS